MVKSSSVQQRARRPVRAVNSNNDDKKDGVRTSTITTAGKNARVVTPTKRVVSLSVIQFVLLPFRVQHVVVERDKK